MARPIAKDYDEKRRVILDRAADVFASEGFDRASMSLVARACDISKATIYHYYASKDDLLFDILDGYLSGLRDTIASLDLTDQDPEDAFLNTVTVILLAYQGADTQHRLQIDALSRLAPEQQAVLKGYQADLVRAMSLRIAALAPELMRDRNKLKSVTMSVFGMLNWFYMWNAGADEHARRDYARTISRLVARGAASVPE